MGNPRFVGALQALSLLEEVLALEDAVIFQPRHISTMHLYHKQARDASTELTSSRFTEHDSSREHLAEQEGTMASESLKQLISADIDENCKSPLAACKSFGLHIAVQFCKLVRMRVTVPLRH